MLSTQNNWLRELCQGISDVDYVTGTSITRRNLVSEQHYLDLEMLFSFNNAQKSRGRDPYVQILTDDSGVNYALLSEDCIKYASDNRLSLVPMIEKDIAEKVSTRPEAKIDSEPLEKVLEDRLPQCTNYKIPRFVGLPSSNIIIGDNLYLRWKKSDEDEFLTTIDIIGGYLN